MPLNLTPLNLTPCTQADLILKNYSLSPITVANNIITDHCVHRPYAYIYTVAYITPGIVNEWLCTV